MIMDTMQYSAPFLKKRKFLMILPLLVLPFVFALFYLFGGGKGQMTNGMNEKSNGVNTQLPDAHFNKRKEADKMSLYESSNQDSAKWREAVKNDPNRIDSGKLESMSFEQFQALHDTLNKASPGLLNKEMGEPNLSTSKIRSGYQEKEMAEKLAQLQNIINQNSTDSVETNKIKAKSKETLERHSDLTNEKLPNNESTDPDIVQLNKMLDKVMAIQHPELISDTIKQIPTKTASIYQLEAMTKENAISIIIPESQTIVSGSTVRLQLNEPAMIAGIEVPAFQYVYGTAMLSNERLKVQVRSIRVGNNILPVDLSIYDMDGMEGLFVPGSISRDVSKQSIDQGMGGIGLANLDPSIEAQAASAGIQVAKTLISRKVKLIQVTIPIEYQALLKNAR
jgi:Conjugative transposon, TraM